LKNPFNLLRLPNNRKSAYLWGHYAEYLAILILFLKGYFLLGRRFSAAGGEIDLIVKRGNVIVFVEVKARASLENAQLSIDSYKKRRISRAASVYAARYQLSGLKVFRADAVFIAPWRWPLHVVHAFELEWS
jgi:putative endonuclease